MRNTLTYKGYTTTIAYSTEDHIWYGKIEGINDLVCFDGDDKTEVEKEFHIAVDDYLDLCAYCNKTPEKPYINN